MRISPLLLCLLITYACSANKQIPTPEETAKIIETAILGEGSFNKQKRVPEEMEKLVAIKALFKKQGDFYQVKGKLIVFGQIASFVGIKGINFLTGPNVTLLGTPQEISEYIAENHGREFKEVNGAFVSKIKNDFQIIVGKHPNFKRNSIIIGAYKGT